MTKTEAKKEVQKLLAAAEEALSAAAKLMDEHQFTTQFMERTYFPRNMELVSYDTGSPPGEDDEYVMPKNKDMNWIIFYKDDYGWLAGEWKSSSEYKSC